MADDVPVEERGKGTSITLNRPGPRNAYDPEMAGTIVEALDGNTRSHAVVISGVPGSFCVGSALDNLSQPDVTTLRGLYRGSLLFDAVRIHPRLGMLVQAIGSPDKAEGAQASLEERIPGFAPPDADRPAPSR